MRVDLPARVQDQPRCCFEQLIAEADGIAMVLELIAQTGTVLESQPIVKNQRGKIKFFIIALDELVAMGIDLARD